MARPSKQRKVCKLPSTREFRPVGELSDDAIITMTVDEYETIRLIDLQGFSQQDCGEYMHIGRTTVQSIYNTARNKLARMLVFGMTLRIDGGNYQLCPGDEPFCACGGCKRHLDARPDASPRKEKTMKIAISVEENKTDVCPFAARSPYFLFCDEEGSTIVENPAAQADSGAGIQAAQFLIDNGVTHFIAVRLGMNAAEVLKAADIKVFTSANKTAEEDIAALRQGKLIEEVSVFGGFHGAL